MSWAWMPSKRNEMIPPRCSMSRRAVDREAVAEAVVAARRARTAVSCRSCSRTASMPSAFEVVDRRRRARWPRRSACVPGLELPRHLVGDVAVLADVEDHLAAAEERRHRLEQLGAGPEAADAARAEHLVAGEPDEVGVPRLHVDRHRGARPARRRRAPCAPAAWAASARERTSLTVPSTFDIAVNARSLAPSSSRSRSREVEAVVVVERDPAQLDAALGGEDVPRHDVGVVLHLGEDDRRRPRARLARAHEYATRLIASVMFLREHDLARARARR